MGAREAPGPEQPLFGVLSLTVQIREDRVAPGLNDPLDAGESSEKLNRKQKKGREGTVWPYP